MRNSLIKIGAILILALGIIFSTGLIGAGIYILVIYADGGLERKALISGAIFITALIILATCIAVFEALWEVVHLSKYEEELEADSKWTDRK